MSRWILDAGAFVAFERGDANFRARLEVARHRDIGLATTSPIIAQVWRDRRRQVLLARLVTATHVEAPDLEAARRAGELLARTATRDVVDALLVGLARPGDVILTSDPDDIATLVRGAGVRASVVTV